MFPQELVEQRDRFFVTHEKELDRTLDQLVYRFFGSQSYIAMAKKISEPLRLPKAAECFTNHWALRIDHSN